jgi:hypothetical protein
MSAPQRKPGDKDKFRKEWLANLALSASNNQLNQNASNMFKQTGASSLVKDFITPTEKAAKAEGDKALVKDYLSGNRFMNSYTAGEVANNLLRPDDLRFILEYQDYIAQDFKPREVPGEVFVNYVRRLKEKTKRTQGVEFGLQEVSAHQLLSGLNIEPLLRIQEFKQRIEGAEELDERQKAQLLRLLSRWEGLLLTQDGAERIAALGPDDAEEALSLNSRISDEVPNLDGFEDDLSTGDVDNLRDSLTPSDEAVAMGLELNEILARGRGVSPAEDPDTGVFLGKAPTSATEAGLAFASAEERGTPPPPAFRPIPPTRGVPSLFRKDSPEDPTAGMYDEPEEAPKGALITPEEFYNRRPRSEKAGYISNEVDLDLFNTANGTNVGETGDVFTELMKLTDVALDNWYQTGYEAYKAQGGKGLKGNKGAGLGKKKKKSAVERSTGYVKPQPYTQLGSYLINKNKLKEGVLMVKYPSGQRIAKLPSQAITKELASVINVLIEGKQPSIRQFQNLSEGEKDKLHQIVRTTGLGVDVPNQKEEEMDKELNHFEILKGEIIAGNDNPKLIKEFKAILIKFGREGRIPRREVNSILEEMLHLGH